MLTGTVNDRLEAIVHLTVDDAQGASLDIAAVIDTGFNGFLTLPPATIAQLGLEWLYRLIQEPGRLWRRYLVTNTVFLAKLGCAMCNRLAARLRRARTSGPLRG